MHNIYNFQKAFEKTLFIYLVGEEDDSYSPLLKILFYNYFKELTFI